MSSNEGFDLDELGVEVPTAADVKIDSESGYPFADITDYGYYLNSGDDLVRREDHSEALVEAVQQERRRIKDKLLKAIQNLDKASKSLPESVWYVKEKVDDSENILRELEEEVEKNQSSKPKTGKSDNFGETDK